MRILFISLFFLAVATCNPDKKKPKDKTKQKITDTIPKTKSNTKDTIYLNTTN